MGILTELQGQFTEQEISRIRLLAKNPMFDPSAFINVRDRKEVRVWYHALRYRLYIQRDMRSDLTGLELKDGFDLHHSIVSRADVPRGIWWHPLIHCEFNAVLLRPEEHRVDPPSREWGWEKACSLYGTGRIEEWYLGLPWKAGPPRLFGELKGV